VFVCVRQKQFPFLMARAVRVSIFHISYFMDYYHFSCELLEVTGSHGKGRNVFLPSHSHTPIETNMRQGKKVETKTGFSEQIYWCAKKHTLV
jgi:hypothetical protein